VLQESWLENAYENTQYESPDSAAECSTKSIGGQRYNEYGANYR
jgi:hypothetical protein